MFSIAEVMCTEVLTLEPDDSLHDARQLMAKHHIRHIPIVGDNNRLIGLVSQRDVLAAADSTLVVSTEVADAQEAYVALSAIMTEQVRTVNENDSLRGAALYLQRHKVGCLPVIAEDQTLIGIITDSDFVGIAINLMEQLEAAEPEENDFLDEAS